MIKTTLRFALAALALRGVAASAQLDGAADVAPTTTQDSPQDARAISDFKSRLSDDGVVDSLARRIAQSSLGAQISAAQDQESRVADIRNWIRANPDQAAGLAVGLSRDDASQTHGFENALNGEVHQGKFVFNPASSRGIYGRLRKTSGESKLTGLAADQDGMHAEEQSEIMRSLFEGKGGGSNKIITRQEKAPPGGQAQTSGAGVLNSGYYDRLSRGNLHGYSPQLQALQSALNRQRPPGAPPLIETGKLDYATLSFPVYALRYDIGNLEDRLRLQRNFALAKQLGLGQGVTRDQLLDPNFEAQLLAKAAAAKTAVDPRFSRRMEALAKAAAAARAFDRASIAAKSPAGITRALLLSLGGLQKEAARWITAASLEDERQRLDAMDGFLSQDFLELLSRCPVASGDRDQYRRRGDDFEGRLQKLRSDDSQVIAALESADWIAQAPALQRNLDADTILRKTLERDIADYVKTPYLLVEASPRQPRWRQVLDDAVRRYLPSTPYGRRLSVAQAEQARLRDVFLKIAVGDLEAAHAVLAAGRPQ